MEQISKKLPFEIPLSETYQSLTFVLGIIRSTDSVKDIYYNTYCSLSCELTTDIWKLDLKIADVTWEDFRRKGIAEMDMYYLRNIAREKCAAFLRERIDQDNYLLLYGIDEYYISYSKYYKKKHYSHDLYVFGYEKDSFLVLAYTGKKMQTIRLSEQEIVDGLYGRLDMNENTSFCSFRIHHLANANKDFNLFVSEVRQYLEPAVEGSSVTGIVALDVLKSCVEKIAAEEDDSNLDIRAFRMIWEHELIFEDHVKAFKELGCSIDTDDNVIEKLLDLSRMNMLLAVKYNVSFQKKLLVSIIDGIEELRKLETEVFSRVANTLA